MKTLLGCLLILLSPLLLPAQGNPTATPPSPKANPIPPADSAKLTELLQMGYLLSALNKHEDALAYFQFVLRDQNSKEIRNNAGLSAVLDALSYFRPREPEVKFRYPLELDLQSAGAKGGQDFKEKRTRLLREAVAQFDTALLLDPRYAPAYLNKACALALLGDTAGARVALNAARKQARQPAYTKTAVDAQVLLGILHERQGHIEKAQAAFSAAKEQGSRLGAYNLGVLTGKPEPDTRGQRPIGGPEKIDNWDLNPYELPEVVPSSAVLLGPQLRFYHNLHPGPNSYYYFNDNTATAQQTYILLTAPEYAKSTAQGLKVGDEQARIDSLYGTPKRVVETVTGHIRVYSAILLILDQEGKLKQWAIYGEEQL